MKIKSQFELILLFLFSRVMVTGKIQNADQPANPANPPSNGSMDIDQMNPGERYFLD
jgi:hypothetical protein